jgi:hypothetical protein
MANVGDLVLVRCDSRQVFQIVDLGETITVLRSAYLSSQHYPFVLHELAVEGGTWKRRPDSGKMQSNWHTYVEKVRAIMD